MNCSVCGAHIPVGRASCGTCGTAIPLSRSILPNTESPAVLSAAGGAMAIRACPRCDYRGAGIAYFSRGSHMAGLVAATIFTLPGGFGAGGILYYLLRRHHLICPRCGVGWGDPAKVPSITDGQPVAPSTESTPVIAVNDSRERTMRGSSILVGLLAVILITLGIGEAEFILIALGMVAALGGVGLHRGANLARERRREALLSALQLNVLRLAGERQGRLTVTEVATALAWPMRRAEKVLNSLDDGWRVNSIVTDEGLIVYEFRELSRLTD